MAQMQIFLYTVGEVMVNLFFFKYFKMTHISFGALNAMELFLQCKLLYAILNLDSSEQHYFCCVPK